MTKDARRTIAAGSGALALCVLFALAGPALSATGGEEEARVRDIVVVEKNGDLLVFASLLGAFPPSVLEVIHGGVETKFVFDVRLMRVRKVLYDLEVASRELHHRVKYSALKKTYTFLVREEEKEVARRVTQSQAEMMDWMHELNGVPIVSGKALSPNERYYVRIRVRFDSMDFVFPFNYLLAFMGKASDWSNSRTFGMKGM